MNSFHISLSKEHVVYSILCIQLSTVSYLLCFLHIHVATLLHLLLWGEKSEICEDREMAAQNPQGQRNIMLSWVPTGWEGIISCPGNRQEANSPMMPQLTGYSLLAPIDSARHQHWAAYSYSRKIWVGFLSLNFYSLQMWGRGVKSRKLKSKKILKWVSIF